jgi:hypothetical protein
MMKEDATILVGRQRKRDNLNGLSVLWLLILVLALVGAIVAASSNAPVIWMLAWPAPLIVIFTAARFIGEGFHTRDGVLVFGRPMTTLPNVPLAGAVDSATSRHVVEGRKELEKRWHEQKRSLAHT